MAFNTFSAAIASLTALSVISGIVIPNPQPIQFGTQLDDFLQLQSMIQELQAMFQQQQAQFQQQQAQFMQQSAQFQQQQAQFQQQQAQFQQQQRQFQQQPNPFQQPQVPTQPQNQPVTEVCLGCICDAMSSCDRTMTCDGDVCGMFRITRPYWIDSGEPVLEGDNPNDKDAYERCTNDPSCATKSVISYLDRFAQDCNGDGFIDCLDYAAIHKLGGYGCSAPLDWQFKSKIESCQNSISGVSGSLDTTNLPMN